MPVIDPPHKRLREKCRRFAKSQGYVVQEMVRVFEPDHHGMTEALFIGRYSGDHKAGIPGELEGTETAYKVILRPDNTGYVDEGW